MNQPNAMPASFVPSAHRQQTAAFTLIELSVVLVIIGLIVGGVMAGRNLIAAAEIRAQISQIEKYNTAVNTFRAKYDCLPGDCPNAAQFGFSARGSLGGQGDGNGIIEGNSYGTVTRCSSPVGEAALFWVDLSSANLIDGSFTTATATGAASGAISNYFPAAKVGQGNYIYVWSGVSNIGTGPTGGGSGINYFGLSAVSTFVSGTVMNSSAGLTVAQAYNIDQKIDDGLPQSGSLVAVYNTWNAPSGCYGWGPGNGTFEAGYSGPNTPASAPSCFDNGNQSWTTQKYSLNQSGGTNINSALSFRFQ